jgi:hypothetical protein
MLIHVRTAAALFLVSCVSLASGLTIHVTGKVTGAAGAPVAGAQVSLTNANVSVLTDNQGRFTINGNTSAIMNFEHRPAAQDPIVKGCFLRLVAPQSSQQVRIDVFDLAGRSMGTPVNQVLKAGVFQFVPVALLGNQLSHQLYLIKVINGSRTTAHTILPSISKLNVSGTRLLDQSQEKSLGKLAAGVDVLKVTAQGYQLFSQDLQSHTDTGLSIQLVAAKTLIYDPATGHTATNPEYSFNYPPIAGSTGNTIVGLNIWSPIAGMTERAYVTDPGHWEMYVKANNPAGNVLLFTNTGQPHNEPLLSSYSSITSSFDVTLPDPSTGATGWNGYDIWLNNWADEVMISTHWINAYPCPIAATATFGGSNGVPVNTWGLCRYGASFNIWKLNSGNGPDATALTVDVKALLQWLIDHGYIATKASTITDISFGFEVTNTKGVEVGPWRVNAFAVSMK